jgi:hypothetical protein
MGEYQRKVRIGIAREAAMLGSLAGVVWFAAVLYLEIFLVPAQVRSEAALQPLFYWIMIGPLIVLLNLFLPYAERRTGVKMQEPGAIRTAYDNLRFSFLMFLVWVTMGVLVLLSNTIIDPTYFAIIGLAAYYLAGSAYNRSWSWGPMAKGRHLQ